jgi:hypothetical protein
VKVVSKLPDNPLRQRAALYRELAIQAEDHAESVDSDEDRAAFLRLARQWEILAHGAEQCGSSVN